MAIVVFLSKLNICFQIEPGERIGCEVDYRKIFGKKWRESGGHQDPAKNKPSEEFLEEHPRYMELIESEDMLTLYEQ